MADALRDVGDMLIYGVDAVLDPCGWPDDEDDNDVGPASTDTTMMLVLICNMIVAVHQLMAGETFDVLKNPMVAPSMLTDFLGR